MHEFIETEKSKYFQSKSFDQDELQSQKLHKDKSSDQNENELYDSDAEENVQESVGNINTLIDDENLVNRTFMSIYQDLDSEYLCFPTLFRGRSIYQDLDAEYLCFPTLFRGRRRPENKERLVPLHFTDIAKWELRSYDRRAANSVPNIFFKLKQNTDEALSDKINLTVRKCQVDERNITAAQARNSNYLEDIVKKDQS